MQGQPFAFLLQRGARMRKMLPASRLSWAEDTAADQLISSYKGSLNFPPCPMHGCRPPAPQHPPGQWWSSLHPTAAEEGGEREFRGPAGPAVWDAHPLPLVSVAGMESGS